MSDEKLVVCKDLRADVCINFKTEDFLKRVKEETELHEKHSDHLRAGNSANLAFETLKAVGGGARSRILMPVNVKKLLSMLVTFGGTIKSEVISASPAITVWKIAKERTTGRILWTVNQKEIGVLGSQHRGIHMRISVKTRTFFSTMALMTFKHELIFKLVLSLAIFHSSHQMLPLLIANFFTFTGMRILIQAPLPTAFKVTKASIAEFPALNGQSVSYAILQYPAGSVNPPYTHPRSAELLFLLNGSLQVGFVDTTNKLFTQTLQAGDMFVFPKGLVYYQYNTDANNSAIAISAFGSANAGTVSVPNSVFTTGIDDGNLAKSFNTDIGTIQKIKAGLEFFFALVLAFITLHMVTTGDADITSDFLVRPNVTKVDSNFFTFTSMRTLLKANPPTTFKITKASLAEFPALNGQSISFAVLQYPAGSVNPPHTHPRSAELLFLLDGALEVGLLFTQSLQAGDMFVFPKGVVHYQFNCDVKNSAIAISAFVSANAGTISVPTTVFTTGIDNGFLAKSFNTNIATIQAIKAGLTPKAQNRSPS
ncbi:germin-like protein 9-3 [Quercus suber]|uniref:Germin-like protein 9-3 n=1 Tax=Quercus suber TaxID=58331 RepID=A0AAW0J6H3_QUESU